MAPRTIILHIMAPPYHRSSKYSTRNHFVEPPSILDRIVDNLPAFITTRIQYLVDPSTYSLRTIRRWKQRIGVRTFINVPNAFILIWFLVLLWGEKWVFEDSIAACDWKSWEKWVSTPLILSMKGPYC